MRFHRVTVVVPIADVPTARDWFLENVENQPDADPFSETFRSELAPTIVDATTDLWASGAYEAPIANAVFLEFNGVNRGNGERAAYRSPLGRDDARGNGQVLKDEILATHGLEVRGGS